MEDTRVKKVNTIYTQKVENHPNEDRGYYTTNEFLKKFTVNKN